MLAQASSLINWHRASARDGLLAAEALAECMDFMNVNHIYFEIAPRPNLAFTTTYTKYALFPARNCQKRESTGRPHL